MKSIVILISGRGSNMRAIIDAGLPARIAAVIADRPTAPGLAEAKERDVPAAVIDHRGFPSRDAFDSALMVEIDRHQPDLIVLAGFMRVLGHEFARHYAGRLLNIHPSLLPAFPGLHTHRRALEAGVRIHGCTVHFVTPAVDHGPIVCQAAVPVEAGDDEATLAARVLQQEHKIYPQASRWFLEGRLSINAIGRVIVAGETLTQNILCVPPPDATAKLL